MRKSGIGDEIPLATFTIRSPDEVELQGGFGAMSSLTLPEQLLSEGWVPHSDCGMT